MKIYFEKGSLHSLTQFLNINVPVILTSCNGYQNMIKDAKIAIKNKWDIYTNDISLLGANEIFGDKFLHKIFIKNDKDKWVEFNPHIIKKLETPHQVQEYFRRYVCKN